MIKLSNSIKNQNYKKYKKDKEIHDITSDNCLLCITTNFFINYKYSQEKYLDATLIRKMLMILNQSISIEKFNLKGVKNFHLN